MKKKRMRHLLTVIVSAAMIQGLFAYALPLMAKETSFQQETTITQTSGSLTLHEHDSEGNPLADASYSIYKIMRFEQESTSRFVIEEAFQDVLKNVTPDALGSYSTTQLEKLSQQLTIKAEQFPPLATATSDGSGTVSFKDLKLGYYLVIETKAPNNYILGKPFLIAIPSTNNYQNHEEGSAWVYDVEAYPKNEIVTFDKTITDASDGAVKIGDYVPYQIRTSMPDYDASFFGNPTPATFIIIDTMEDGLAIQNDAKHPITVKVNDKEIAEGSMTYRIRAENTAGEEADLHISFAEDFIKENGGQPIIVTYEAQVTEKAKQGQEGNQNAASLQYNHKAGEITNSEKAIVKVYSFGIQVEKFTNEGKPQALKGADFTLLAADGKEVLNNASTDDKGILNFHNLDAGTYYLKETKSPTGYTLLAELIKVEIIADVDSAKKATGSFTLKVNDKEITDTSGTFITKLDNDRGIASIAIENHKGFTLPSTGGTGITLFLVIASVGILVISMVMVSKSRKQA